MAAQLPTIQETALITYENLQDHLTALNIEAITVRINEHNVRLELILVSIRSLKAALATATGPYRQQLINALRAKRVEYNDLVRAINSQSRHITNMEAEFATAGPVAGRGGPGGPGGGPGRLANAVRVVGNAFGNPFGRAADGTGDTNADDGADASVSPLRQDAINSIRPGIVDNVVDRINSAPGVSGVTTGGIVGGTRRRKYRGGFSYGKSVTKKRTLTKRSNKKRVKKSRKR